MAEERREHQRGHRSELHHAGNNHVGKWIEVRRGGEKHGRDGDQCGRDADSECCRAQDHNLTDESYGDGGTDSDLHGGCNRDSTAQLPVAEERREHQRGHRSELHHAGNNHVGKWIEVRRGGEKQGRDGDQCGRDADSECCRAQDHNLTDESYGDGGTDSDLHGGCNRDSTAQLPVAEERREHQRGHRSELHHAGNNHVGKWIEVRRGGEKHGRDGDQCGRDADSECCRAQDHNLTDESYGDGGTDSDLHGGCDRDSTAQLPVAEERREHQRGHRSELHHAGNNHVGKWIEVRRGGEKHGRDGDQCGRDADSECCRAQDHNLTGESYGDGGTDSDLHGGCDRDSTAQLPVAQERREHQRGHRSELHHAGNNHVGKWIEVRRGGEKHGRDGDQCGRDADSECCRAQDHNLTGESYGDGGTDSDLHGGCDRDSTAQLPVAEERREHQRGHRSELHHAGNNHVGKWIEVRRGGEKHGEGR